MPHIEKADLARMVAAGKIGAISVDTSVFDRFTCNLDSAALMAMQQFAASPVEFLITDVVIGEIRAHMVRDAERVTDALKAALKDLMRHRRPDVRAIEGVPEFLSVHGDVAEEVDGRIQRYLASTEATVLAAGDLVDLNDLMARYFAVEPPFEAGKGKKAEFPDAIALLELETWGRGHRRHVLAVAEDKGWADFARKAEWVIVTDGLPATLALFHQDEAHNVTRAASLFNEKERAANAWLVDAVDRYVDRVNPEVQAQSHLFWEAELEDYSVIEVEPPTAEEMTVIGSDVETLTLSFVVSATVRAEASFVFSIRDSVDGDYIGLGSAIYTKDVPLDVPVVARISRVGGPDDAVEDLSIDGPRSVVFDFGGVEPSERRD